MKRGSWRGVLLGSFAVACVDSGEVLKNELDVVPEPLEPSPIVVSASESHTCAISEGRGHCWGGNRSGQLGVGRGEASLPPIELDGRWRALVASLSHTCGLTTSSEVYCWGDNSRGQLGRGDREPSDLPLPVALARPVLALASGFNHACALLEGGELWCWGDGYEGQLGQDDVFMTSGDPDVQSRELDRLLPVLIPPPLDDAGATIAWRAVDTGEGHTCAIAEDGALWCWGRNSQRQLGAPSDEGQSRVPLRVGEDHDWQLVDAAQNYTCALKDEGTLWCFGYNMGSRTGAGNPFGLVLASLQLDTPTRVNEDYWSALSTNMFHSCAIGGERSRLWCWGRNIEGQLGLDPALDPDLPDVSIEPRSVLEGVAMVSVGTFSTCVVMLDGSIRCAGQNAEGQLGGGDDSTEAEFVPVPLSTGDPVLR